MKRFHAAGICDCCAAPEDERDGVLSRQLNDRARYEWEYLRLMSFHGAPWDNSVMLADLTREDVAEIADLIYELAADYRVLCGRLRRYEEAVAAVPLYEEVDSNGEYTTSRARPVEDVMRDVRAVLARVEREA